MDFEKFVDLQKQMRENNAELADYLDDFASWKQSVDLKDQKLASSQNQSRELPAIRNSLFQKRKKKVHKDQPKLKSKERIKSYDFEAWDKFDVDKALEEVDKTEEHSSSLSETDEELENQRRIGLAEEARNLGNVRFKEGKFDESIEQYSLAIRLCPENPLAYCNRALAYLKTERFASAEVDCTAALKLDSHSVKALFRRALARKALDRKQEAIEDLKLLLNLEPNNKQAQKELDLLDPKPEPSVQPISPRLETSQKKRWKMRCIPIVEVGGAGDSIRSVLAPENRIPNTQGVTDTVANPTLPRSFDSSINSTNPVAAKQSSDPKNQRDLVQPKLDQITKASPETSPPKSTTNQTNSSPQLTTDIPSNWFQLERQLRELCPNTKDPNSTLSAKAVEFLCTIPPQLYASVICQNLDTRFLSHMLQAFCRSESLTALEIANRLKCLADLPRFDVAWLMANERERHFVKDLKVRLTKGSDVHPKLLDQIEQCYS